MLSGDFQEYLSIIKLLLDSKFQQYHNSETFQC